MKAFLNRGAKIKWENTPFQPELTDDRIKRAVDKYFPVSSGEPEQGDFLMWDEDHAVWVPHTLRLNDNTDVTVYEPDTGQILVYDTGEWRNITPELNTANDVNVTTPAGGDILIYDGSESEWVNVTPELNIADDVNITTPAEGDTLVYDATAGEWKNKAPDVWELVSTLTADGTDRYLSGEIPECKSMMIEGVTAAGAAQLTLGLSVSFDGTTYDTVGAVTAGIDTTVKYMRYFYTLNGGVWMGFNTAALNATNATAMVQSRFESFKTGGTFTKIRFFVPLNEVIPDGSEFKIYIKRK